MTFSKLFIGSCTATALLAGCTVHTSDSRANLIGFDGKTMFHFAAEDEAVTFDDALRNQKPLTNDQVKTFISLYQGLSIVTNLTKPTALLSNSPNIETKFARLAEILSNDCSLKNRSDDRGVLTQALTEPKLFVWLSGPQCPLSYTTSIRIHEMTPLKTAIDTLAFYGTSNKNILKLANGLKSLRMAHQSEIKRTDSAVEISIANDGQFTSKDLGTFTNLGQLNLETSRKTGAMTITGTQFFESDEDTFPLVKVEFRFSGQLDPVTNNFATQSGVVLLNGYPLDPKQFEELGLSLSGSPAI